MNVAVVVVAAGRGERLGANLPKALVRVGGKTLLEHTLDRISNFKPHEIVVVHTPGEDAAFLEVTSKFPEVQLVPGGKERQDSVAQGLGAIESEYVLVHDAARAFTPTEVFLRVATALQNSAAVIPALAVSDTLKQVSGDLVIQNLDRSQIVASQTPQGFEVSKLRFALSAATGTFTDEAALMQSLGQPVTTVAGSEMAFKVTTKSDLERAEALFGSARVGIGTDAHAFSDSGTLVLGTLKWPGLNQLAGHSDGDSIAHAIVDALLGAAGLGDIGSNFGVDRAEYAGAAGEVFLAATLELLKSKSLSPINVSVQVIADQPKIGPRRSELEQALGSILGCEVSVSATTTDGLGFLADSKGIAAVATALVRSDS